MYAKKLQEANEFQFKLKATKGNKTFQWKKRVCICVINENSDYYYLLNLIE